MIVARGLVATRATKAFKVTSHFPTTGVIKATKLIFFFKKVNEFMRVKVVIMLNLRDEKVIFIAFYVNDLNKTVPSYQLLKPVFFFFFEKFHLIKNSLNKLKKQKILPKKQIP